MSIQSLRRVQFAHRIRILLRHGAAVSRPKDLRKRKGRPLDLSTQKARILAVRRRENSQEWQRFLDLGYDRAWRVLWEEEPVCPNLDLHTAEFRERLMLGEVPVYRRRPGEIFQCALHWAVFEKSCDRPYRYCKPSDRRVGSRTVCGHTVTEDRNP